MLLVIVHPRFCTKEIRLQKHFDGLLKPKGKVKMSVNVISRLIFKMCLPGGKEINSTQRNTLGKMNYNRDASYSALEIIVLYIKLWWNA